MPTSIKLPFVPSSLRQVREISGCTVEDASRKVSKDVETIRRWESDGSQELPTLAQAKKLQELYRYPLTLFLSGEIPEFVVVSDVPDFRTLSDGEPSSVANWSRNLRWLLRQIEFRQEFVREVAARYEIPYQSWVASESRANIPSETLALKMRELLRVSHDEQAGQRNTQEALKMWISRFEDEAGVFVFQTNNTSNPIGMPEMRGVSLADAHAPSIVLNSRDSEAGRIFTLFHEFVHLWIGESGISGWDGLDFRSDWAIANEIERFCDRTSSTALMPKDWFVDEWDSHRAMSLDANIQLVSDAFKVSRAAVAVRAVHLDRMDWSEYSALQRDYSRTRSNVPTPRGGGGNYYATQIRNLGRKYVALVLGSFSDRYIGIKEAANLLEVKVNGVHPLANHAGFRV